MSPLDELRLRVHAELAVPEEPVDGPADRALAHAARLPTTALVLDTETTTDAAQRLLFGWYQYLRVRWRRGHPLVAVAEEGLFHAEDLALADPTGYAVLEAFASANAASAAPGFPTSIRWLPLRAFLDDVLLVAAVKGDATVVGLNLAFDLSRIASGVTDARGRSRGRGRRPDRRFAGGHSLVLWPWVGADGVERENRYRPRLRVKHRDSKSTLMAFASTKEESTSHGGQFLDLRTLAFALTDRAHSLESAGREFGLERPKLAAPPHGVITPEYVAYARRDVDATAELLAKLLEEFARHPIARQVTKVMSPATIGKGYLRAMGVRPVLERQPDFPREVLAAAMIAYYGGRAEAHVRRLTVPVVYLDYRSMYPLVNALLGLWGLLTAERVEVAEATDEVRALLAAATPERVFEPSFWRGLVGFAELEPDGDVLPARLSFDGSGSPQIAVSRVSASEPVWWSIPDAVASALLAGRPPRVRKAIRLVPRGRVPGLEPVRLRGEVLVDPAAADFFRAVVEERARTLARDDLPDLERQRLARSLKVLANSTSYGIYAEVNAEPPTGEKTRVRAWGLDGPFETRVDRPELPGEYYFPPLASVITGAARLMLALLERCVTDLGGTWAVADTDSFAVVATERGGPVPGLQSRALSWSEVEAIRARFASLNPFDPVAVPGSVLKLEDANLGPDGRQRQLHCFAVSAKRYALYTLDGDGQPQMVKWSEHGLGHLLNPTDPDSDDRDWMRQVWEGLVREALGLETAPPPWLDRPAVTRTTVSSAALLHLFDGLNRGRPYAEQVKPGNFLLSIATAPFGHPSGADPDRFHLVAPYTRDARQWAKMLWTDRYSGRRYRVRATGLGGSRGVARVQTYRDVVDAYRVHPEAKGAGPDGRPSGSETRGELGRLAVHAARVRYVGKESNRLEEVEAGLLSDEEDVTTEYVDRRRDPQRAEFLAWARAAPTAEVARVAGVDRATAKRWKAGSMLPSRRHVAAAAPVRAATATAPAAPAPARGAQPRARLGRPPGGAGLG